MLFEILSRRLQSERVMNFDLMTGVPWLTVTQGDWDEYRLTSSGVRAADRRYLMDLTLLEAANQRNFDIMVDYLIASDTSSVKMTCIYVTRMR